MGAKAMKNHGDVLSIGTVSSGIAVLGLLVLGCTTSPLPMDDAGVIMPVDASTNDATMPAPDLSFFADMTGYDIIPQPPDLLMTDYFIPPDLAPRLLAQDNFMRPQQPGWGTASD